MGGSHLIGRGLAVRSYPGSKHECNCWHSVAATKRQGQKSDLVTGLKCSHSVGMETSSDTFKRKIPEFVQLRFPLRFLRPRGFQFVEEIKKTVNF